MVFKFILLYEKLNLAFFTLKKRKKVIKQTGLTFVKVGKNNNKY